MSHRTSVLLEGCCNFRELEGAPTRGGRTLRGGLLYRSDSLDHATERDADAIRERLRARTLIDLRGVEEMREHPVGVRALGARYFNLPLTTSPRSTRPEDAPPPSLLEMYLSFATSSAAPLRQMFEALSEPDGFPAVIFCAAGKDRTGVAVALLLGSLNVDDGWIVDDYARTARIEPEALGPWYAETFHALPSDFREARPVTMRAFLGAIRREFGSIRAFVAKLGVTTAELRALEAVLLTDD